MRRKSVVKWSPPWSASDYKQKRRKRITPFAKGGLSQRQGERAGEARRLYLIGVL